VNLHKLTLKNFRQFKGIQELQFAAASGTHQENVTVVFGENGRGKTGIFRAILFCLYGDQTLSQDEEVDQNEILLVNSSAIEESAGKPVDAFVQLEFSHGSDVFSLRRDRTGMLSGSEQIENQGNVILSLRRRDGNTENIYDPEQINQNINEILDRKIREYFLFDGEKIQRLTLASLGQRREIARGIKKILNIDAL
jgi:DNA sulfur modification protein DndD